MRHEIRVIGALAVTLLIGGCGGGGGGGSSVAPSTGPFSLEVIDAPVDPTDIARVCIAFSAVTVHYSDEQEVRLDYEPLPTQVSSATHCTDLVSGANPVPPVRLDALSGALTVSLVDSLQIPTGRVTWIRLHFTEGSYVFETAGGMRPLTCPSCEVTDANQERGFKLNRTFEITSAGLSLIADIDLRKSLTFTRNRDYILRPTARVERNDSQGTISGNVATLSIIGLDGATYLGGDEDTGCAVYVFPNDNTPLDDVYEPGSNVVSTAAVRITGEPEPDFYGYAAGALPVEPDGSPKTYRVALTCDPDNPEVDDVEADIIFTAPKSTQVSVGQVSDVDFP